MKKKIEVDGVMGRGKSPSLRPERPKKVLKKPSVRMDEVVGEDVSDRRCCVCQRDFKSRKALYGNLRSHPDRGWRGSKNLIVESCLVATTTPTAASVSPIQGSGLRDEAPSAWGLATCSIEGHLGAEDCIVQATRETEIESSVGSIDLEDSASGQSCELCLAPPIRETYANFTVRIDLNQLPGLTEENPSDCCSAVKAPALDLSLRL